MSNHLEQLAQSCVVYREQSAHLVRAKMAICEEYSPYDVMAEFREGFCAYERGNHRNSYDGIVEKELAAQAWGSGAEAAMRCARLLR